MSHNNNYKITSSQYLNGVKIIKMQLLQGVVETKKQRFVDDFAQEYNVDSARLALLYDRVYACVISHIDKIGVFAFHDSIKEEFTCLKSWSIEDLKLPSATTRALKELRESDNMFHDYSQAAYFSFMQLLLKSIDFPSGLIITHEGVSFSSRSLINRDEMPWLDAQINEHGLFALELRNIEYYKGDNCAGNFSIGASSELFDWEGNRMELEVFEYFFKILSNSSCSDSINEYLNIIHSIDAGLNICFYSGRRFCINEHLIPNNIFNIARADTLVFTCEQTSAPDKNTLERRVVDEKGNNIWIGHFYKGLKMLVSGRQNLQRIANKNLHHIR